MRQELKIKPKHWLMALGLVIGGFLLALACIFGIIELLSPYADFIADNIFVIIGSICSVVWMSFLLYLIAYPLAEEFAKREIRNGGRKWKK